MKRLLVLSITVVVLLTMVVLPASASWTWCYSDPLIKVPGENGVFSLVVSVPKEYQNEAIALEVTAPAGSRIIGKNGRLDIHVNLQPGPSDQITAVVGQGFPVMFSLKHQGTDLGAFEFDDAGGTATWNW